jgi:hypothetical protein
MMIRSLFHSLKTEFNNIVQDIQVLKHNNRIPESDKANTLILINNWSITQNTLNDLMKDQTVAVVRRVRMKQLKSKTIRFIYKTHCCRLSNRLYKLPGKSIWYNYSELFSKEASYQYILVYSDCLFHDDTLLSKLKKKFPYSYIYVFVWDTLVPGNGWWLIRRRIQSKEVYMVLTFDKSNAEQFGWIPCLCYYSKIEIAKKNITTDLYFTGLTDGNRIELINNCYCRLSKTISCEFNVRCSKTIILDGINILDRRIPYIQILQEIQSCNCILEIVKDRQTGPSLRYFEAVCYNKKLLTNNPSVVDLPFYDERYIHVFKTASDIDADWVARREPIDYHYDGRFSPIHMIELIRKLSEKNNA